MKKFFSLLLFFFFVINLHAQHLIFNAGNASMEAGLNFGPTFFLGDLGGNKGYGTKFVKDINLPFTKAMKGIFATIYPTHWYGLRVGAQYTYLEGSDQIIKPEGGPEVYRYRRDLDFRSNVWEVYTAIELFPMMFLNKNDEDYLPRLRPYFFAGVGVFHFNPMGSLTDNYGVTRWYYLRPLRTEGEGMAEYPGRKEYALTQMNIPWGGGLKYYVSENVIISLELLYRKTFTDYIDDVSTTYIDPSLFDKYLSPSQAAIAKKIYDKVAPGYAPFLPGDQRGNPGNDDAYFSFLLKFGFRIGGNYSSPEFARAAKHFHCPGRF